MADSKDTVFARTILNPESSEVVNASNPIIEVIDGDSTQVEEFNAERFAAELSRLNREYQETDDSPYNQGARDILAEIIYEFHCDLGQPEEEVRD